MAGNEDVDGDVSGEEAAWRDLVARFDLPVDTEAAQAPWPARENLTESARDRQRPDQEAEGDWDEPGPASPAGRTGPASLPTRPGGLWPEPADEPGPDAQPAPPVPPVPPGTADTDAGDGPAADGAGVDGAHPNGAAVSGTHLGGTGPDGTGPDGTGTDGTGPKAADSTLPEGANGPGRSGGDRPRIIRRAGPGRPDQVAAGPDEDEDDRYVPPPPEPLPPLDPVAKGAWAGVLGGPAYLVVALLAGWEIPGWVALLAIVAFVAGFATLVVRMGDRPRDDDDDGAVV